MLASASQSPQAAWKTHFFRTDVACDSNMWAINKTLVVSGKYRELLYTQLCGDYNKLPLIIEGSLNRNFRQYGELKSRSRVVKSVDRRCNSQKVRRKKIHPRQMLEKSRNAVFFHRLVCRVSPKVGLLKRRVRRKVPRGDIKNCTTLWRKAHFEVKMYKTRQLRSIFGSYDVAKLHAAVAKSTCGSENVKKQTIRDHFWKFTC